MNETISYSLAAMIMYGLSDVAHKRGVQAGAAPHQFLMVQTWVLLPLVLVYGVVTRTPHLNAASLWGAVAAIFSYAAFIWFAKSLRSGAVSVVVPVFRLGFVVTALLAVTLSWRATHDTKAARTWVRSGCGMASPRWENLLDQPKRGRSRDFSNRGDRAFELSLKSWNRPGSNGGERVACPGDRDRRDRNSCIGPQRQGSPCCAAIAILGAYRRRAVECCVYSDDVGPRYW